ncbi:hypothetical protein [Flammeovirga agarivorans]|uniref:Uncharacterized protein n=1 Tax=Flammeovirga agarivorans TaxID=2726742 RepID=A0A7X8XVL8_9BACT|nr:hypothetical protein [Flammeovirga agarivorans]NLR91190.1 hypothetical protein [Flammeovirga agarivorans]
MNLEIIISIIALIFSIGSSFAYWFLRNESNTIAKSVKELQDERNQIMKMGIDQQERVVNLDEKKYENEKDDRFNAEIDRFMNDIDQHDDINIKTYTIIVTVQNAMTLVKVRTNGNYKIDPIISRLWCELGTRCMKSKIPILTNLGKTLYSKSVGYSTGEYMSDTTFKVIQEQINGISSYLKSNSSRRQLIDAIELSKSIELENKNTLSIKYEVDKKSGIIKKNYII